jgi:hypothetical protein
MGGLAMPAKSFVMAFVLSGWLVALVIAGLIVAYTGFFGLAVLGLIVLALSVIVDQDRDGAVGTGMTPGFMVEQVKAQAELTPVQRVALQAEQAVEARSTHLFRLFALGMIVVGLLGFWIFQV